MAYDLGQVLGLCQSDAQKTADKRKAEIAKPLRMHANGDKIKSLIEKRYPTEPDDVHKYRMENLPHITGIFFNKVANVISGIPQSKDFVLNNWNKSGRYADFEQYCTREYPQTGNIINWIFNDVSEEMLIEPNGIIVAGYEDWFSAPLVYFQQGGEYDVERPITRLYKFEHIKAYKKNEYLVLKRDDKKSELVILRNETDYSVYVVFGKETVDITPSFPLEDLPAFILGGKPDNYEAQEIYRSFVSCAMPPLDKVIQYTSEEDLMIKESIYAILVMVGGDPCGACMGGGIIDDADGKGKRGHCKKCSGRGYIIPKNSSAVRVIAPPKQGEQLPSGPLMWWVQPDISIIKPLTEAIEKQWYLAYSSINFEFIAETPAAQAGIAKAYDRQTLNSFIYKIASRLIDAVLRPLLKSLAILFYKGAIQKDLEELVLPTISTPRNFDALIAGYMESELLNLRNAKADPSLIVSAELDMIDCKYANQPIEKQINRDSLLMRPGAGTEPDYVAQWNASGVFSDLSYYLYSNAAELVRDLYATIPNFYTLPFETRQSEIIKEAKKRFPTEQIRANIMNSAANDNSGFDLSGQDTQQAETVTTANQDANLLQENY